MIEGYCVMLCFEKFGFGVIVFMSLKFKYYGDLIIE